MYPIADTSLFEYTPDNNLGAATLVSGTTGLGYRSRALIQFSNSDFPTNVVLLSAKLNLKVARTSSNGTLPTNFDLHRMLRPWGEGNKTANRGSPADPGEATWNAAFFPTNLWTMPGAAAPGDFVTAVSSTTIASFEMSFTNLLADVHFWLAHPDQNFGWILIGEREDLKYTALRFYAREWGPPYAPTLVLEFTYLPEIHNAQLSGDQLTFDFYAQANLPYFVQYCDSLSPGNWISFTNYPAQAAIRTVVVSAPVVGSQRFYRVGITQNSQ